MDFNVEARKLQLENLNQFISSYKYKIENVLTTLNWNTEDTLQDNQFITCSLDPSHKVPQKAVDKHINKCALRKEGYELNEDFLSEPQQGPSSVQYTEGYELNEDFLSEPQQGPSTIHINDHTKIEVLSAAHKTYENFKSGWNGQDPDPRTSDRLTATFSADERLALYNYAIANTIGPDKLPEFDIFTTNPKRGNDKPLSHEEKLALERDLKRRKIKYRSVHTSHKNHTEVLREVIESQMELYTDWLSNANRTASPEAEVDKLKQEHDSATSVIASKSSRTSRSTSRSNRNRHDEKHNEETNDSRSTSRKSSIDRGSEKSMKDSNEHRKQRSRSRDSYHRRRNDRYEHDRSRSDQHRRRRSPSYHRRDRYRRSKSRERRRSREKHQNGYRHRRS
ncbi:hypothetical protein QE152_g32422 [Popillia japonica]|uniref:CHHC U11-48K-type domain-containing protein n=1 Tax=Popillia japonica TaxID=7064 RepID=A0AAW1IZE0_POPJA